MNFILTGRYVLKKPVIDPPPPLPGTGVPFRTVEEAWFWFIRTVVAREMGASLRIGLGNIPRPCQPMDIYRTLDRLYRSRRILWKEILVMNEYGRRRRVPNLASLDKKERDDGTLWRRAMLELDTALRQRGIIRNALKRSLEEL